MTTPNDISPDDAAKLLASGAVLVDIREPNEWPSGVIAGSVRAPLSTLGDHRIDAPPERPVIFHCKGGARTRANAVLLQEKAAGHEVYLLQGGIDGWRAAGRPVEAAQ